MEVELALTELMRRYEIPQHRSVSSLASYLGINRQAASRLVNGHGATLSYAHLAGICTWLVDQVDSPELKKRLLGELPGKLIRFSGLWARLRDVKRLTLCVGERMLERSVPAESHSSSYIAGVDAEVALDLLHQLLKDGAKFDFRLRRLPLHLAPDAPLGASRPSAADESEAERVARALRGLKKSAAILIGSQRANLLVEFAVAEAYGIEPFRLEGPSVPFFTLYRKEDDYRPPSCFGASELPDWIASDCPQSTPGLYYLQDGAWRHAPWEPGEHDAGVVLVATDAQFDRLWITAFGFSVQGTKELGKLLLAAPESFWPKPGASGGRRGAFLCSVPLSEDGPAQVRAIDDPGTLR